MARRPGQKRGLRVRIAREPHAAGLPLPAYQTEGAAGLDLVAAVTAPLIVEPGSYALVKTGLRLELPRGYEAQVRPRSGLALKHGVTVLNAPGTIDSDYRGEVGVVLINHGREPFTVSRGDRIAQMVIAPVTEATVVAVEAVGATARGRGGFGSTGRAAAERGATRGGRSSAKRVSAATKPRARSSPKGR